MSIVALLCLLGVASLGLMFWTVAIRSVRRRAAMKRWPVEQALILDHRTRIAIRAVSVDIQVTFRHASREFRVWCVSPTNSAYGPGTGDQGLRQELRRFPKGATAPVYVNPVCPDEAYLELPEQHMIALLLGFGALFIGGSLVPLVVISGLLTEEMAKLYFMLFVAAILSVFVISLGGALLMGYLAKPRKKAPGTPSARRLTSRPVWRRRRPL